MDYTALVQQFKRLKMRFGEKAFDEEFCRLAMKEVSIVSEQYFIIAVDRLIGSRTHTKPPMIDDFRQIRLNEERHKLTRQVEESIQSMNDPRLGQGLRDYLVKHYPGCSTVQEAVEIERLKLKIEEAEKND